MQVDIYVWEKNGNREIRFPILPEKFEFSSGDMTFITSEIMGRGEVAIPSGTELSSYSWESELPGELRRNDPLIRGSWQAPDSYINTIKDWQKNGTLLTVLITGYPVNADVYCKEFKTEGAGPFGDVTYDIEFIEARDFTITTNSTAAKATTRQATTTQTYTIKSGDTLWAIAQKHYGTGTKWESIYSANKEIIESTAKAHGKSSSQNGHWIYPGTIITLP